MLIGNQAGKKRETYFAIILPGARKRTVCPIVVDGYLLLFADGVKAKITAMENWGKGTPGYCGKEPAIAEVDKAQAASLVSWVVPAIEKGVYCLDGETLASEGELFEDELDPSLTA